MGDLFIAFYSGLVAGSRSVRRSNRSRQETFLSFPCLSMIIVHGSHSLLDSFPARNRHSSMPSASSEPIQDAWNAYMHSHARSRPLDPWHLSDLTTESTPLRKSNPNPDSNQMGNLPGKKQRDHRQPKQRVNMVLPT